MVGAAGHVPTRYAKIGDDVAVVPLRPGKLVFKVDMLVEHTDVPPGMTYRQAARKAVAMCVSDFASKGARPDSFMISLGLKEGTTKREVGDIAHGLSDAASTWGVHLVGGDTNEAEELVIDCAMIGFAKSLVTRQGASPGEVLVVTGPFGYPPSGLKILMAGARAEAKFAKVAKMSVLKPSPNLEMGLALAPYLTSAMDSSDGLARSIHTLARQSEVGFEVTSVPMGFGVRDFASSNGLDAMQLVFGGGEEYVIVGTVKKAKLREAKEAAEKAGGRLLEIGTATSDEGRAELKIEGKLSPMVDAGWTHLAGR